VLMPERVLDYPDKSRLNLGLRAIEEVYYEMNVEEFELLTATLYLIQLSVAQNHKVPSGYLIGKDVEGSNRYPILRYGPGICLERVNKTTKDNLAHCFIDETWTEQPSNRIKCR